MHDVKRRRSGATLLAFMMWKLRKRRGPRLPRRADVVQLRRTSQAVISVAVRDNGG
ncbi:MAG: hypothetical protein ACLR9W_02695 [Enterobacter hormaechei]